MITINDLISKFGIDKLNSLTKYPSILTYHSFGDRGMLQEELSEGVTFTGPTYVTEKNDGTNSRIVLDFTGDYLIGSRENFLTAKFDRISNPALGIVDAVRDFADALSVNLPCNVDGIVVIYGESYGGNITAASKQYTSNRTVSFRIFDIALIPEETCMAILSQDPDHISSWREHRGQDFQNVDYIQSVAEEYHVAAVPYLEVVNHVPTTRAETYEWLTKYNLTQAGINTQGKSEGIVVRTYDRSLIRKIRFEDYERTKKRMGF